MNSYSGLTFIIIFIIIITYGNYKKVDCYNIILNGTKEAFNSAIILFSTLFTFSIALALLQSCGFIDCIEQNLNFKYTELLIQMIIRPLSSSSSYSILHNIINKHGVDSLYSLLSTIVHYASDSSIYLLTIYTSYLGIKLNKNVYYLGYLLNIFSYLIGICLIVIFYYLFW